MLSFTTAAMGLASPMMSANPDAPIKLGVNGFGRIGRQVVRIAMERESFVLKHINSPMTPEYMKYLLEHDTVHGRFKGTCDIADGGLIINGLPVSLSATRDPTEIPWSAVRDRPTARRLRAGGGLLGCRGVGGDPHTMGRRRPRRPRAWAAGGGARYRLPGAPPGARATATSLRAPEPCVLRVPVS